jgi:hypothetical protein
LINPPQKALFSVFIAILPFFFVYCSDSSGVGHRGGGERWLNFKRFDGEERTLFNLEIQRPGVFSAAGEVYKEDSGGNSNRQGVVTCKKQSWVGLQGAFSETSTAGDSLEKVQRIIRQHKDTLKTEGQGDLEGGSCNEPNFQNGYRLRIDSPSFRYIGHFRKEPDSETIRKLISELEELLSVAFKNGRPAEGHEQNYQSGDYPEP